MLEPRIDDDDADTEIALITRGMGRAEYYGMREEIHLGRSCPQVFDGLINITQ